MKRRGEETVYLVNRVEVKREQTKQYAFAMKEEVQFEAN